jgi:hypothetical protein
MAAACTSLLEPFRDHTAPPGLVAPDGTINPCHGEETDHQRCGNARFSARHVAKIPIGATPDDVRAIMRLEPEARETRRTGDAVTERWSYLTDYERGTRTTVVFVNGRVAGFDVGTPDR